MRDAICDAKKRGWDGLGMWVKLDATWRVKDRNGAVVLACGWVDGDISINGPRQPVGGLFQRVEPSTSGLSLLKCMAGRLKPKVASSLFSAERSA